MEKEYSEKFCTLISLSMEFFPSFPPPVSLHRQALSATQREEDLEKCKKRRQPDVTDGKQGEVEANSVGLLKYLYSS
jgi:hypothetical protein